MPPEVTAEEWANIAQAATQPGAHFRPPGFRERVSSVAQNLRDRKIFGRPLYEVAADFGAGFVVKSAVRSGVVLVGASTLGAIGAAVVAGAASGAAFAGGKEWFKQARENWQQLLPPEAVTTRQRLLERLKDLSPNDWKRLGIVTLRGAATGAVFGLAGALFEEALHAATSVDSTNVGQNPDLTATPTPEPGGEVGGPGLGTQPGADQTPVPLPDQSPTPAPTAEPAPAPSEIPLPPEGTPAATPPAEGVTPPPEATASATPEPGPAAPGETPPPTPPTGVPSPPPDTTPTPAAPPTEPPTHPAPETPPSVPETETPATPPEPGTTPPSPGELPPVPPSIDAITETVQGLKDVPLAAGSNPWEVATDLLKQVDPNHVPSNTEIMEVTRAICEQNNISVPEWDISGTIDEHRIPIGYLLKIDSDVKSVIIDIVKGNN